MAGDGNVDFLACLGQFAEILVERPGEHVASLGEPADMGSNDIVEVGAAFGNLLKISLQCLRQEFAPLGDLGNLLGNQSVDC